MTKGKQNIYNKELNIYSYFLRIKLKKQKITKTLMKSIQPQFNHFLGVCELVHKNVDEKTREEIKI